MLRVVRVAAISMMGSSNVSSGNRGNGYQTKATRNTDVVDTQHSIPMHMPARLEAVRRFQTVRINAQAAHHEQGARRGLCVPECAGKAARHNLSRS
jgi:hypothetical protein